MLADHAEDIICNHPQFKNEGVHRKLSGRETFQIHVGLHLAVKLLLHSPWVWYSLMTSLSGSPKFVHQVSTSTSRNKVELSIFVNGTFRNFVIRPKREITDSVCWKRSSNYCQYTPSSRPRAAYILAVLYRHLEPAVPAFMGEISFDNEETALVHKDCSIVNGIMSGIQAYKQGQLISLRHNLTIS